MNKRSILITGGAGYIGSHVALHLAERAERVIILDNISRGFRQAARNLMLIEGDVANRSLVSSVLKSFDIDTIMHFAAFTIVPESVREPLKYYDNNTCGTRSLIESAVECDVRHFVFSSTAAVYGVPQDGIASEDSALAPINPYGASKLMSEWILRDTAAASNLRYVALRYFNVAGSDVQGRIGQATPNATLLVKVACEVAVGKRPFLSIFGTDYPTPDGTGVRDYVHVEDLASAHLAALDYLRANGASAIFNAGYGHGYSVREVIESVERVSGKRLEVREQPRRAGDPPQLIARTERIRKTLAWEPRLDDLDRIVATALAWERKLIENPWGR